MIRSYVCNLMFRDRPDPIVDSENPNWRFFHGDIEGQWYNGISFSNPSLMGQYNKGFNSMKIFKPNYYIKNIEKVDMRKHWEYTLSLRFRIDQEWMSNMVQNEIPVPGLQWDEGLIMLYDHRKDSKGMCMSITMGKQRLEAPIDYESFGYNQPIHLLLSMNKMEMKGNINGVRYFDARMKEPTYVFRNLKLGNFLEDTSAIVEYDELCMVDQYIYKENFNLTKPFHALFPETEVEEDDTFHIGVASNSLIRVNESEWDQVGKLDIVRHVDFEPPTGYRTDQKRKYEYQYKGLEDHVASSHK